MPSERDDVETYAIVRKAVRDGIWDFVGEVFAAGLAVALLAFGVVFASRWLDGTPTTSDWLLAAFGLTATALGAVYVLRTYDLLPFAR